MTFEKKTIAKKAKIQMNKSSSNPNKRVEKGVELFNSFL
jgi:hypothetical protein